MEKGDFRVWGADQVARAAAPVAILIRRLIFSTCIKDAGIAICHSRGYIISIPQCQNRVAGRGYVKGYGSCDQVGC